MATPNNYDAKGIIDFLSKLDPEMANVLNGKAMVTRIKEEFKNQSEEGKKAAERMAENLRNSGNNISAQLQEIEREASKAGYNIFFSYNEGRRQIDIKMERRPDVNGDKNAPAGKVRPVKFNIDVGSVKAGYNNGVPSTKSLSVQQQDDRTYLATETEDVLRALREALAEVNKTGRGENKSTAYINSMMKEAEKKAMKGLVAHTNHASVNSEYFEDDRYEGDSRRRQLYMRNNAKMAGLIDNVIKKILGEKKKFTTTGDNKKEIDVNQLQRDLLIYIEARQKKSLGEGVANGILKGRGYSDADINSFVSALGEDILSITNTMNLGSDRSMATLTESYEGARDMLLSSYGDSSRHITQGRNTVEKISGGKRRKITFRESDLQSNGYYDTGFEHEAYTSARITPDKIQEIYLKVRNKLADERREDIKAKHKKWSPERIEKEVEAQLKKQGFLRDFDPSVDDDMMIVKESSLKNLKGTRLRSTKIDSEEYDHYSDEISKKIKELINSGKNSVKLGSKTYDLKDEKSVNEYKNKLLIASVISGLDAKEIYGDVSVSNHIDENGKNVYSLSAKQIVGGGQQEKVVTGIGERNYGFAMNDIAFGKIVDQMVEEGLLPESFKGKDGEHLDFIRSKDGFKSNEMAQLAISRLSYLFGKTSDKNGFVKQLQDKKHPLSGLIKGITEDGTGIEFDQSDDKLTKFANIKNGGLRSLYEWMENTDLRSLGINEDGKVFDPMSDSFIYETTAGLADVFKWTKRVQTGSKERDAQARTASVSGSSDSYKKQLEKRYEGSNEKDRKEIEQAEKNIKEIQEAITKKNTATKNMSDEDVENFIKNNSYIAGSKDKSKKAITMGVGDKYTINTENYKDIIAEYERGHLSQEEFDKTWEAEVQRIKNEMIKAGIDESEIETIIDPGQQYGFSAFDKQYRGRLLHLGNTSVDSMDDLIDPTKKVYNRSEYSSAASSLFRAMGASGDTKGSRVSEAATSLIKDMFTTSYSNKGALNERANKRRLGHSASFKTSGISPEQIDEIADIVEKDRLIDSGFISESAMKSLLKDTHDYEKIDGSIDEDEYLKTLYAQYAESDKFKTGGKKAISFNSKKWGSTFEEKQNKLIEEIMEIAKSEGLRGMFNRFPSIDSEAVKNSRLFVSDSIKSKDIMKVGSGLAKSINADFDGDTINVILKMLQDYSGDNTEEWDKAIMKKVYGMRGGKSTKKSDEDTKKEYQKAIGDADDVFLKEVSGLAAKVNNQYIGNFSNMSTSIRNALGDKGYDERSAIYTDGKMNQSSFEKIAKGLIVKALGQTLEQDAISAKKVEKRIVEEIAAAKEKADKESREFTDSDRNEIATRVINDFDKLSSGIRDGSFKSDSEIISRLNDLGITKAIKDENTGAITGHEIDSLAMNTAIAQIQEMADRNGISREFITKMFGGVDIMSEDFSGNLNTDIVSNLVSSTSKSLYGNKKGFFYKGDQFNPAAAVARENNPGAHADQQQIIKISDNTEDIKKIEEANVLFDERGEILRAVADAYKYEIGMEEKKIGVALREADAIRKAGKSWKDYSDLISKKYKLDEEAEKVAGKGDFYVASNKVLSEGGFTRTTPSAIKNILNPRTDGTTGLDKSVLDDRIAKGLFKPKKGELVKAFGVDSEKTLMSLFNTSQSIIGGNLAHAIAQGDKTGAKEFETELKNLLNVFGKSTKEIETVISAFQKAGINMSAIADNFGTTVGNELPIAGVSTDGNYLINGRMDTLRYQQRQNQYTGKMDDVYTILDYKTRAGTSIKHDDVAQVVMYQEMFKDMQKTWMTDDRFKGMSDKDLLDVARVDIAKSLSGGERSKEAIDNLVNSLTEEDINRIRNGARIESGVVVGDSRGGASQAYKISGSVTSDIKDMVMGGDWEKLSPDQIAALLSMQQKITSPDFYKEGNYVAPKKEPEKPKTKDDKEAEKKKNQEDFVKLLEQEYKLRLKIAELKGKKALSTNDEEKKNLETLIGYNEGLLNKKVAEREKAGKKAGLRGKSGEVYKNNVLSAEEAKYQLELQKLAERLTKGTGGIVGKKGLFDDFGKQLKGYFVNMFSAYRIIGKITQELKKCVQIAKELDKSATNIRIVTGMSGKEVDGLMRKYTGLARELGVTTQVVAQAGQEWMRQGYSAEQANDLIISSTKLSKLGMMDMNNATKVLTSTMKGFKLEASEAGKIVDKLTKLDMNYATTAADIGEAMSRTAAIANQMGVSLDETAAMVTTIMDITQQSAEMTGTAIRTMLSRYGNVKSGSFVSMLTDGEDLDKINDIEKVLSVIGIEIRSNNLSMIDYMETLEKVALKWATLSDVEKNAIATAFAGTRQRNQFVVLMDNWGQVEEAIDMAANSAGTADEKYGVVMDSIEARLNKLQTAWEEFTQKLGASSFVKGAVSALTFLVENLDKILTLLGSISAYLMAKKLWANVGRLGGIFNGLSTIGFKKGAADVAANPNGGIINRIFGTTQRGFTTVSSKLDQIMAIMRGEKTGDAAMSVVDSTTVTQRAELNKANKLEIKNQKEKLKYLKAEEKVHGFNNSTDKAETQSKIDRLEAQNTALKGKGFDVGDGKTVTMRKGSDGNMMYYATTINPKTKKPQTRKINPNSKAAKNALAQKKAQTKQRLAGASAMGIASGVMAGMSGTNSYFGNTIGSKDVKINDINSDTTDNIVNGVATGAATGLISAIPGIGPILGPIIGDGIGGLIKFLRHRDEINRKQRVEEAKKNLEALNKIEDATTGVEGTIFNINDAQSMSAAKESVDELINTLLDDGENRRKIMNELGNKFGFAVDELGNTTMTTADLEKILLYGTDEEKSIATNTINQVTNSESATEKYKSQEDDRFKNEEKLEESIGKSTDSVYTGYSSTDTSTKGAIMDSLGLYSKEIISHSDSDGNVTYETKRSIVGDNGEAIEKNAQTAIIKMREIVEAGEFNNKKLTQAEIDAINAEIKSLEAAVKGIDEYNAETEKLNKELHGLELEDAFRSSGLAMWNAVDVANTSLETVIQTFANNLELTGVATRDATGMITKEARQQIETYLRSNEQFSSLFNNGTKTLNEMVSNVSKQNELVSKTGAKSFDELKDAFDRADAKKIEEFANAAGIAAEELMGLVYHSDSSQLSSFARALNMTTEEVLALQDKLGSITLSDLIKTPAETREAFNELAGMFSEISTKGAATGETLEKLNSNYFNLYNKYDDLGNVVSTGSENLIENLRERLFGDAASNGTQAFLYQNATFQDLKGNTNMYKSYLSTLKESDIWDSLSNDQRATLTGANTLTDVIHLFNSNSTNGEALQNTLSEFLNGLNLSNDYYTELQNKLVEWQKHDNQLMIDGLQSQIDSLDEINEEREREIELIKAKDALENAKKEKKRVYRAGVGWTYESNQEKISEAKDKLDEVERELDKENLQYQIDLLEKQNSMLDNMAKNEELKALKAVFDEYNTYMKNKFGKEVTSGFSEIIDLAESDRTMTWSTYVENMGTEQAVGEQVDITNMINKANDIAYLDSVLAGMTKDLSGEELTKMLHSEEYISRQTARKNAYDSFLGSVSNLRASGASDDTIDMYLSSGLESKYQNDNYNNVGAYTATKYDGAINDEYYYLKSGFGTEDGQTEVKNYGENQYLKLVPQGKYTDSDITAAMKLLSDEPDSVRLDYYDEASKTWKALPDDASVVNGLPNGTIIHAGTSKVESSSDPGHGYAIKDGSAWENMTASVENFAKGTFGLDKAVMAMINELGTEGIVTPQGTLTALPSKTGIVPADLTKNLYDLGEVAPNLIKRLGSGQTLHTNNNSSLEDNSMNVENLYATFETDEGFDFEKLLISARQYIKNTKGTR